VGSQPTDTPIEDVGVGVVAARRGPGERGPI